MCFAKQKCHLLVAYDSGKEFPSVEASSDLNTMLLLLLVMMMNDDDGCGDDDDDDDGEGMWL